MRKKILILKVCCDANSNELLNVATQASLYGIEPIQKEATNMDELQEILRHKEEYDYIYLCTHGDKDGFGTNSDFYITWANFACLLCESGCMKLDSQFFLACCHGGLTHVAYNLFYFCKNIRYVCGPKQTLYPQELLVAYNIFLFTLECRHGDPVIAVEKIKNATDLRFECFERDEIEMTADYYIFEGKLEAECKVCP